MHPKKKEQKKEKVVEYETLNSPAVQASSSSAAASSSSTGATADAEEEEDEFPDMTPELAGFAKLKVGDYESIFHYVQDHPSVVVPGASDALLVEAFSAETKGNKKYAKQCVQQSLILQYCDKLGRDGVSVFFKRMTAADPRAETVFRKDFEETYEHMAKRAKIVREEEAAAPKEQIQLVAADAGKEITFNVPDGPPPEDLRLEGPGTEDLDIEQVRAALQMRWDVFQGFSPELQAALNEGTLDSVNAVLGKMDVPEAEAVVQSLQLAGILSFADEGRIRDAADMPSESQA